MWKPKYFHEMTTNSVYRTIVRVGEPELVPAAEAGAGQHLVDEQTVGREDHGAQTTPVMTSESTYGAKKISRHTPGRGSAG